MINMKSELIENAKLGDQQAILDLIQIIKNDIYKFSFYLCKNAQEAEDLTQDALIQILKKLNALKDYKKFKSWSLQITRNLFIDNKRSQKPELTAQNNDTALQRLEATSDAELSVIVQNLLQLLDENDRTILILVDIQGLDYGEASGILKIPIGTIKSRLFNARKAFMKLYNK